jgi:undecaprenyl-diphosphatase
LNPYLQSVLLGIVEGLTEFLPVSSTAHLRITEALMKIPLDDAYWKMYTIVIQLGAILALCCSSWAASSTSCAPFPRAKTATATGSTIPSRSR